jgi:predicted ATPase/class 3 adenylate cyclase
MAALPTGTVTFLFTDLEGSTALWERHPVAMRAAVARHDALLRQAVAAHGGHVFRTVGDGLCAAFARSPDAVAAALTAQQALRAEPWDEVDPLRARMALHTAIVDHRDGDYVGAGLNRLGRLLAIGHGGQVLLSSGVFPLVRDALPAGAGLRDLGEHRLRDLDRPELVYQLLHADLPADFPPLRSLDAYPHNLPLQLTSFVGREQELAEFRRLLATTRLLTLTGAGGCGKTRLALQVAADLVERYPDGVWLVDLAPLTEPDLVPQAVASAVGVRDQPGEPLATTLLTVLWRKHVLLVLDNCEHLLDACATLAEALLQGCPGVRILATSRELLGVAGETAWRVPSLSTPDPAHLPAANQLLGYAAVRLLVERARQVQPTFAVTEHNAPALAQICRRLDGIPLALELAAARATALSAEQIAARLDDRFRLLTGGRRTALRRQQTLAAAIDWSHDLLAEPERILFRRLSVFAGGWTLAAAEAVGADEGIEAWEVLDLLTRLVEKSLVVAEASHDGETRYRLLETVRQYAGDKLLAAGEAASARDRHRDWCLNFVEQACLGIEGHDQITWIDWLEAEHDNLRAALSWSHADEHGAEAEAQLAGALAPFWVWRGYLIEGRERLAGALARSAGVTPAARARVLKEAGWIAALQGDQGDMSEARALLTEALALVRLEGDLRLTAQILRQLGAVAIATGSEADVRSLFDEALSLARQAGAQREAAMASHLYGRYLRRQGESETALRLLEDGLIVSRASGDRVSLALIVGQLGQMAMESGDYRRAHCLIEEELAQYLAIDYRHGINQAHGNLGDLALAQGDLASARAHYRESLVTARDWGDRYQVRQALSRLAWLCLAHRQYRRAAWLLAAGHDAQRVFTYLHERNEQARTATRAALGEAVFAAAWAEGEALTLEEAVAEALADEPIVEA